jgi:hypothetical protein
MSGFERRGLPFRDVFDSSFDEVVRVHPLDLASAHVVLARRVARYPKPFAALCHCLAGGLARDVIRAARATVVLRRAQRRDDPSATGLTLRGACEALLRHEIASKCDAVAVAAVPLGGSRDIVRLHRWLEQVRRSEITPRVLLARRLDGVATGRADGTDDQASPAGDARRLELELAGFLYHAATLLDFVIRHPAPTALLDENPTGDRCVADELARARLAFSLTPEVAWYLLTQFRVAHGLPLLDLPPSTTAALLIGHGGAPGAGRRSDRSGRQS